MFHLYGFMIGLGIVAAWTAIERRATKPQRELVAGAAVWIVIGGVVGARLYHLATDWQLYKGADMWALFAIWNGGLGIYGAIIGGVAVTALYLHLKKQLSRKTVFSLIDLLAVGLPLGQAIGRWGNYFNQELFGLPTTLPWGIYISLSHRPAQFLAATTFHPLFLYESLAMLVVWVLIWTASKRQQFAIGSGRLFGLYLFAYGIVRFLLDFLRIDRAFWLSIPIGQAVSLVAIAVGTYLFTRPSRKSATI